MSRMAVGPGFAERESLLLRGSLDICVLAILAREPMHAYGVVRRLTDFGINTGYGTVYPLVTRLSARGLVTHAAEPGVGGPTRNVLSLTPAGRTALDEWVAQWRASVSRVDDVLQGGPRGEARDG
jgi:PadR family transcriptional regulator PadR